MGKLSEKSVVIYRQFKHAAQVGPKSVPAAPKAPEMARVQSPQTRVMETPDLRMEQHLGDLRGTPHYATQHTPPPMPRSTSERVNKPNPVIPATPKPLG
jgi:hypothetical protein